MKLATLKHGGRDGTLVVVSRDLTHCRAVPAIARTLQAALDDWDAVAPQLRQVYDALNSGAFTDPEPFDPARLPFAAAARLPVGRRLGLREPRRAGAHARAAPSCRRSSGPTR